PLTGRKIPVIADEYVDKEFGSGVVKITPAHDFNDYEVGKRHNLPLINIFTVDAAVKLPGSKYDGLDRYKARKAIVADLEAAGLVEKIDAHKMMVPRGDRSGAVLEPWLTDQWYVRIAPLAERAIRAVEDGDIRFVPANWDKTYFEWMRNIKDWCISRQLWWGHRIPAWYGPDGAVYVGRSEAEVRSTHGLAAGTPLVQDEDVLDTWFSSALWPFSTLGWPADTAELRAFYPTSVLVTGFDIIFFWVARMIMFGLHFTAQVPFREVYVHGLIRDHEGQKMSKSKGNVIDPLDIVDGIGLEQLVAKRTAGLMQPQLAPAIERATRKQFPQGIPAYGTDALRFTFAALATQSRDLRFDLGRVEGYRNFCNKLWNAARFVLMSTENDEGTGPETLSHYDRWIRSRLQAAVAVVRRSFADYRFDLAAQAAYEFTWYEFCDWYLEFTKTVLQSQAGTPEERRGTRRTLIETLETLLRLLHPLMPFITEELWHAVAVRAGKHGASIMREPYPTLDPSQADPEAEALTNLARDLTLGIRGIRGSFDIAPSVRTPVFIQNASAEVRPRIETSAPAICRLAGVSEIRWLAAGQEAPQSATASVGALVVHLPMAGLIDVDAELARLDKRRSKVGQDLSRAEAKLANDSFVRNAPAEVVAQEQARVLEFKRELAQLAEQFERVASLR
ncbi:MAG TPA: valine--tRNA ligase, partial [Steroidobacteraceae bacterium]|nr:valine--tRNA ligase [Steroidobacteraceae bacterium]